MQYQLTLRVLPDSSDPKGIRRLRMALKTLLRAYRLRTVYIREVEEETPRGRVLSLGGSPSGTAQLSSSHGGKDSLTKIPRGSANE